MNRTRLFAALMVAGLAGCASVSPVKPDAGPIPAQWRTDAPWEAAKPDDAQLRGDWWALFGDAELDRLEALAMQQSASLDVARAKLAQASAQTRIAYADWSPQLALNGGASRAKTSADRPLSNYATQNTATVQNSFALGFSVSYELDISGRVRDENLAAQAGEQSARADFENTRLLLAAQLAADYANLRELDAEIAVVNDGIAAQRRALDYVTGRQHQGVATKYDVAQQQALVDSTATQVDLLVRQRQVFEHAIATLCGVPAPGFVIMSAPVALQVPAIPLALPSTVLQRRPDVAAAERSMQAANAQIGLARSAYFPSVMLSAAPGVQSNVLSQLFNASSSLWSLGVAATQVVFDGGRIRARVAYAEAGYQGAAAGYRQTVLNAMQEVQDGVSSLATLNEAARKAKVAVDSAHTVYDYALQRYKAGVASSLDVVNAQQGYLNNQRLAAQVRGQQWVTAIYLVKALGGGWNGDAAISADSGRRSS